MICDATHEDPPESEVFKCGALGHAIRDNEWVNVEIPLNACVWDICNIQI